MAKSRTTTLVINAELKKDKVEQDLAKLSSNLTALQQKLAKTTGASMDAVSQALLKNDMKSLGVLEQYQKRLAAGQAKIENGAKARREAIEKRYDLRDQANVAKVNAKFPLQATDLAEKKAEFEKKSAESLAKQERHLQRIKTLGLTGEDKTRWVSRVNSRYSDEIKQYRSEMATAKTMAADSPAARKELKSLRAPDLAARRREIAEVNSAEQASLSSLQSYVKERKNAFKEQFKEAASAQSALSTRQEDLGTQKDILGQRKKAQAVEESERRKMQVQRLAEQRAANLQKAEAALGGLSSGAVAAGGAFATTLLVQRAAEYEQLRQRVIQVSSSLKEAGTNMSELRKIAEYTGQSMQGTVAMFARIAPAMQANNLKTSDTLDLVAAFQSSLRASGTNMEQAAAAAYQLSQSLSSGVLRGDELNSVIEGAPAFAKALADSIGVTIGQMKQLGEQGQLTTDVVANAAKQARPTLDAMAKNVPITPMQQLSQTVDRLVEAMSKLDKEYGILDNISKILGVAANNADLLVKALLGLAVASVAFKSMQLAGVLGRGFLALGAPTAAKAASGGASALSTAADVASIATAGRGGSAAAKAAGGAAAVSNLARAADFAGRILLQVGKRAWPVALAFGAIWAYNQVRDKRDMQLRGSQEQLGKAEKENVDAGASGDVFRMDRARQDLAQSRKERIRELEIRQRRVAKTDEEYVRNSEEIGAIQAAQRKAEKDAANSSSGQLRTGDILSMRGALKLDKVQGYAGMQVNSDVADQVRQVGNLVGLLSGSKTLAEGVKATVTLSDLAQAIEILGSTAKSSTDITTVINALTKGMDQLSGDSFNMVNTAVQNLMDRLTETINSEIKEQIKSTSTRLSALQEASSAVLSNRANNALFRRSIVSAQSDMSDYAAGRDSTSRYAKEASDRLNIQKAEEQGILRLKLDTIDKEKAAKMAALTQNTSLQLSETDRSEKKTRDTIEKYIEENTKSVADAEKRRSELRKMMDSKDGDIRKNAISEYQRIFTASDDAFAQAQGALYDSKKLNVPAFIGTDKSKQLADLNEIKAARESIAMATSKAQQDIERNTNRERLALLKEYQRSLETSIGEMLKAQVDYAKRVVDGDREVAQKRIANEQLVRDQKKNIASDEARMNYLRRKAEGQNVGIFDPSVYSISANQETLKDAQERLRTAPGEVEQRKAIGDIREAAKDLLETKLGQIQDAGQGGSEANTLAAKIRARQEYLQLIEQAVIAEKNLDQASKDSLVTAQKILGKDLGTAMKDRERVQTQTGIGTITEQGYAQSEYNKLKIAPEAESLTSLRKSIEQALAEPFSIRFAPNGSGNGSAPAAAPMQPVTINIGDKNFKAQMNPLDVQQLSQIAGGR